MPIPTPFHPRTSKLCTSLSYKDWGGYYAVCAYGTPFDREYQAFRQTAGLIDVTPLMKYEVVGPDAGRFLSWVTVRNIEKLNTGRVTYCCWCDGAGKVLDDGTVTRWAEDHFRVTSNSPALRWFQDAARGFDVAIEESTDRIAVLALQGPSARKILAPVTDPDIAALRYFGAVKTKVCGIPVEVTRTGYTGDLGYEIWTKNDNAVALYDAVLDAGKIHGIEPCGLDAMDVTRIEAGFVLHGVDYFSAKSCLLESQKSTPFEIGLGWSVQLKREPFIGSAALAAAKKRGAARGLVGLEIDWDDLERLFDEEGLPPSVPCHGWRDPIPVYSGDVQVGRATSGVWSPILKKNLALATVESAFAATGTPLLIEQTVEFARRKVRATVVRKPFFDPERKRS